MIAVFAKDQDLISADLYASIVLAVLISTIIPPFALRFTLSYYNKIAAKMIKQAEDLERQRANTIDASLGLTREEQEKRLRVSLFSSLYFVCSSATDALTYPYQHQSRKISRQTRLSFFVFKFNADQLGDSSLRLFQHLPSWGWK